MDDARSNKNQTYYLVWIKALFNDIPTISPQ